MRNKRYLLISLVMLSWLPLAQPHAEERIKIGVIAPLSGDFAKYGELVRQGIEAGAGGKVDLIFEDERCLPAPAVTAFRKLVDVDKVSFILGPCCGSPQEAVAPLIKNRNIIMMFPSSAPQTLFARSGGSAFSSQYAIEEESAFNADVIFKLGHKKVLLVASTSEFSMTHEAAFREHFKGEVIDSISFPVIDREAIRAAATKIKKLAPDALYVPDVSPFMYGLKTQLNQLGMSTLPVFSIYAAQSSDVLTSEGVAANGLMYSYPEIGSDDAINYFPRLAAEKLVTTALECKGSPSCVRETFLKSGVFGVSGALRSQITLRRIAAGKFGEVVPIQ